MDSVDYIGILHAISKKRGKRLPILLCYVPDAKHVRDVYPVTGFCKA